MPADRPTKPLIRLCTRLPLLTGLFGAAVVTAVPLLPAGYAAMLTAAATIALIGLPCVLWFRHRGEIRSLAEMERQLGAIAASPANSAVVPEEIPPAAQTILGWNRLATAAREWRALGNLETRIAERLTGASSAGGADVILNSLGEGVGVTDLDGRLTLLNNALAAALGGSDVDELVGENLIDRLSEIAGNGADLAGRRTPSGVPMAIDVEHDIDGSKQFLRCARRPQLNDASEVVGHVWSIRDITQQRSAEASREEFVSMASHELRTPLANINAYAETLKLSEEIDVEQQKDFLNTINAEATRLGRFVDELLDVTRMQCGSLTLDRRETDLERLVQEASVKVAAEAERKRIELTSEFPAKLPKLKLDKDKFAGAIVNLLGNAVKYTPDGGSVRFRIEVAESQLAVVVEDTGIGISEADLPRVFDRFFRSENARIREVVGSGLGLAFTKEVARLHGGDVSVQSELGKGSRFVMTADFEDTAKACLESGSGRVVFDMREVSLIDSSGLEGLIDLQEQCLRKGGALKLAGPSNLCSDILHVTGIDEQIEIFPDPVTAAGAKPVSVPLGERLVRSGIISHDELETALVEQQSDQARLGEVLLRMGIIDEDQLLPFLEQQIGIAHIQLRDGMIDPKVVRMLPRSLAEEFTCLAMFRVRQTLTIAMADPQDLEQIDRIETVTGLRVRPVLAMRAAIEKLIPRAYEEGFEVDAVTADMDSEAVAIHDDAFHVELQDFKSIADGSPVVNLVNYTILHAVRQGASDIHIEPGQRNTSIRFRVDGQLREVLRPRRELHPALISRIKVMGKMDIAEHRIPQDGRVHVVVDKRAIDLRVSTLPTILGEKAVIRVLDRANITFQLEELGMSAHALGAIKGMLAKPYGLFLVTGPTGSGKTTTLYSATELVKSVHRNIVTVEDPVEYQLDLINQVQVNPASSLSFAKVLRSILRQDPDVIMVGEIRDAETAEMAIQAALTGHLVLATLHTNDSASAVTRLVDMGVPAYKIATAFVGVVAQRLAVPMTYPNSNSHDEQQAGTALLDAVESAAPANRASQTENKGAQTHALLRNLQAGGSRRRISKNDLMLITTQLSIMTRSGMDLSDAVFQIARNSKSPKVQSVMERVHFELQEGRSFSAALSAQADVFGGSYVASVAAGEASGTLVDVLIRLKNLLRNEVRMQTTIRGVLMYPIILLFVALAVLAAMLFFVLPQFDKVFRTLEAPAPAITQILLDVGHIVRTHAWLVGLSIAGVIFAVVKLCRTEAFRRFRDRVVLQTAWIKTGTQSLYTGRVFRMIGAMLQSGVPLLESIRLCATSINNVLFHEMFARMESEILSGQGISGTLSTSTCIPSGAAEMVSTAERSGDLGSVLEMVGEFYEDEGERRIRNQMRMLEPAIIVLMGGLVESTDTRWTLRAAERIDLGVPRRALHELPLELGTRIRDAVRTARYHGHDAVCLLPDGFYERESFEFEENPVRPVRDIVAEHLNRKHPAAAQSRMSDFWTYPLAEPGHFRAEIVSVATDVISDLVEKLKPAGLEVHCLDSPPTVAARAVRIARLRNAGKHVASIDWGDRNATYTITSNGDHVFARTLRNAGFRRLIEATASGMGLDEADAETLLERYGTAEVGSAEPASKILTTLTAHSFDILHGFREELSRTQQYVRRRFPDSTPDTLVMLGGGALLSILRDTVGDALGLEPQIWSADRLLADRCTAAHAVLRPGGAEIDRARRREGDRRTPVSDSLSVVCRFESGIEILMRFNLRTLSLSLNLAGFAAVLGVAGACYGFAYLPLRGEADHLRLRVDMLKRLQASCDTVGAANRALRSDLDRLRPLQEKLESRLPNAPRQDELLNELSRLAITSEIQLQDFQPLGQSPTGDLNATTLKLHLRGDFEKLCRFLAGIETLKRLTRIADVKVRIVDSDRGILDIQVRLLAFYQPGDKSEHNRRATAQNRTTDRGRRSGWGCANRSRLADDPALAAEVSTAVAQMDRSDAVQQQPRRQSPQGSSASLAARQRKLARQMSEHWRNEQARADADRRLHRSPAANENRAAPFPERSRETARSQRPSYDAGRDQSPVRRAIDYSDRNTRVAANSAMRLTGSTKWKNESSSEWKTASLFQRPDTTPPKPGVGKLLRIPLKQVPGSENVELNVENDRMNLKVREAPLNAVLNQLALQERLNIVAGSDVNEKISVTLHGVTLREALDSIMSVAGCTWTQQGNIIYVSKVKVDSGVEPRLQGRQLRVIPLNFIAASDVEKSVKSLMSPAGKVFVSQADPLNAKRTSEQIVIEDLPPYVARIVDYIHQVDHPPRQVQIEAHVLQVRLTDDIRHGVNFTYLKQLSTADIALSTVGFANPLSSPATFFSFDGNSLDSLLELLKRTTQAKTLASPQVMVVNGQQAKIQIGERLGYLVTTTTQTSTLQDVQFLDVGVVLTVTPQITADNQVLMRVKPKVSQGQINADTGLPEEETTDVETTVMLPDGQGIVIGGLIQEADDERQSKIPLLGDLWLAGRLFQRRSAVRDRTEIIIALVPRIVPYGAPRDQNCELNWQRASNPLFKDGLQRNYRPSEPDLPDAVRNPRRPRLDRFKKFFSNLGESHPRTSEYYFPPASTNPKEPRYPNLTNDHRRLTQQSRISLGGLVNSEGIIEQFLQKAEVEFEPVQRFRKIYSLYLKAVPDYLDPPLEFMTEKVLPLDSDLSDTRKKKLIKERLKQYFKFAQKPPKWIQDPEWPINNGEPLFFVGQVTINAPELFHDTGEAYVHMVDGTFREVNGRQGPYARDYTNKMVYAADRQTALYAGGNHGRGRTNDVWEYHLGSNTWHALFPAEGGDHARFKWSLMFAARVMKKNPDYKMSEKQQAEWNACRKWWKENVVIKDGMYLTRNGGPLLTGHTWDTLVYEPNTRRMIHGTGAYCAAADFVASKFTDTPIEDVRARLSKSAPRRGYKTMWFFDPDKQRWNRYASANPLAELRGMGGSLIYIPDWKKVVWYYAGQNTPGAALTMRAWDPMADQWTDLKPNGGRSLYDLAIKDKIAPRSEQQMAYSPKLKRIIAVLNRDTYSYDLKKNEWSKREGRIPFPAHDAKTVFAYDSTSNVFLLASPRDGRLAAYDANADKWTEITPKGPGIPKPPYCVGRGYYDPTHNVYVVQSAYRQQEGKLAEAVVDEHWSQAPDLGDRYGPVGRQRCLEDAQYHLRYLSESVEAQSPVLFEDYIQWVRTLLEQRNVPTADLSRHLEILADVLRSELTTAEFSDVEPFIDAGIQCLTAASPEFHSELETSGIRRLADRYLAELLAGQRHRAVQLILDAIDQGTTVRDIYLHVFQPVQREVGRLWQMNRISIAEEHFCTAVTQLVMSQLYPQLLNRQAVDLVAVCSCIGSDLHELGARMIADFLELEGWDTYYLGANTPTPGLIKVIGQRNADLLALSATMTYHLPQIRATIAAVRKESSVKIVVGGRPFNLQQDLWKQLQKKSDQLQRMNEEKNRAMGIVAHDLRNPLSIFKLFSGFLLESGGDRYENDELEILKTMSETSDSMIQMVANLLDASAIEAGRLVLESKHFDLRDLLQRVVRRMAFIATQSDVRLELKEQTDCDMHINGDEGKLEQVFCNLIDNAIRFSPPGEVVTIAISQSGSDITVSVSDAGPGIPESVVPHLFKPFAAAKSTEKSGTGLGLSIAKRVIDEHGGSIRLDTADQSGTTFLVSIPALSVAS
eukprot:g18347.t1